MLFDARAALARIRADAPAAPAAKPQSEPASRLHVLPVLRSKPQRPPM